MDGFAADEDGKTVFATVGKGETRANSFTVDFHGESDAVANSGVTGRIAHLLDTKVINSDNFPGIERVLRAEESKMELAGGIEGEVANPETRRIGASVNLGRNLGDAGDGDEGVITDDFEILMRHISFYYSTYD